MRLGNVLRVSLLTLGSGAAFAGVWTDRARGADLSQPNRDGRVAETLSFNAVNDFSRTQGYRCWFYTYNFDTAMVYGLNWWGDSSWCDPDGACAINFDWMHPGIGSGSECNVATRKWLSPASGQVRITGDVHKQATQGIGGNGVIAGIYHDSTEVWSRYIAGDDTIGFVYDLALYVAAGDALFFALDADGENWYDSSSFNPTITLVTGLEDDACSVAPSRLWTPTFVRGVLFLPQVLDAVRGAVSGFSASFKAGLLDITGRKVMELVPGTNDVRHLQAGVYFVRLQPDGKVLQRKVVIVR